MSDTPDISSALTGIFSAMEQEHIKKAQDALNAQPDSKALEGLTAAVLKGDFVRFRAFAIQDRELLVEGLLRAHFSKENIGKLQFLFEQSRFVERHFRFLLDKREGSGCVADKTRTILRAIFKFLAQGTPIKFDYEQEYTYHLPTTVFKDHESILVFFNALYRLWYGQPIEYATALALFLE